MDALISYLLKSIILSGLLMSYYVIALKNKKFHYYNRGYLLSVPGISLIIPLVNFKWFTINLPQTASVNSLFFILDAGHTGGAVHVNVLEPSWLLFYILVSSTLLFRLIVEVIKIYTIKRRHVNTRMDGFTLIETELTQAPFSFLNNLFWRKSIDPDTDTGKKIYRHELTHIKERHSYDKLFARITVCIAWINPFYWLMQHELNMVHEFIADAGSVKEGDTESFARMLLASYNNGSHLTPSHSFFASTVRRRLKLIASTGNKRPSLFRKTLTIPIIILMFFLSSFTVTKQGKNKLPVFPSIEQKLKDERNQKLKDELKNFRGEMIKQSG